MKKFFTTLLLAGGLFVGNSYGQSFTVAHDTISFGTGSGLSEVHNDITNLTSSALTIQWKVASTNFPSDWIGNLGICDNFVCISSAALWPAGSVNESNYPAASTGGFKMQIDLSSGVTSVGTYYMRVRFNNKFGTASDTAMQTYIVNRNTTSAPVTIKNVTNEVTLYPNPATNALNVIYDASADIRNIAIYSIIGKQMNMYRVTDNNSASLNLESIPAGIYFVRLLNSRGDIVTTRKFTKQ